MTKDPQFSLGVATRYIVRFPKRLNGIPVQIPSALPMLILFRPENAVSEAGHMLDRFNNGKD